MNKFKVKEVKTYLLRDVIKLVRKGVHANFAPIIPNNSKFNCLPMQMTLLISSADREVEVSKISFTVLYNWRDDW